MRTLLKKKHYLIDYGDPSGVSAIKVTNEGLIQAASDYRKGGHASAF
jgi:hypothetical protein